MQSKIFIGLITGNEKQNIQEIVDNLGNIDGILAVDHYSTDGTYELLEKNKRGGDIIRCPYQNNHSQSMNIWMNSPKLNIGDWVILLDSSERIGQKLLNNIKDYVIHFERCGINTIVNHSKVFMFRRWPQQFFSGTPHWKINGTQQYAIDMSNTGLFEDEKDYYYSVRNRNRDPFHWTRHYAFYLLQKDSNHLLLGLEGKPNFVETFTYRENERIKLLLYFKERNLEPTIDNLILLFHECNDQIKYFINTNKILNDYYHFYINNDRTLIDNHNWDEIKKI